MFQLVEDGAVRWKAPPLSVRVVDAVEDDAPDETGSGHDGGHSHDHSHGEYHAKFFTDPALAQAGVRNIRDGLIDLDPDHAGTYEDNAAAFIDELEALHEEFETQLADRERDLVVLAGHDSFRYLGERYGFEIHTPVGLSPDREPTPDEIAETVELAEQHGIDCVLWDYFDDPDLAELIADEADHEVEVEMVTPAESVTEEWAEEGVGDYLSQMEAVNLPSFERALGAN